MRHSYSMFCLPSALPGNKGLQATVRRHIKDLGLGAVGLPGFHPWVIQAYAIFAVPRDASFRSGRTRTGNHLLNRQTL